MTSVWYYANTWADVVVEVPIDRHSDNSVWVRGRRKARESSHEIYAPTWELAQEFLLDYWGSVKKQGLNKAAYADGHLEKVLNLRTNHHA